MTRTFTVLFLLAALFTLTACPPDPGASSSSSSEPVSGVTTNIIENAMTIYFRDGYPYADPVMWLWISNSNGMNVAASGTTNLNGFAFKVYTTNVRSLMLSNFNLNPVRVTTNGLRYYFKFKDGVAGTQWEWMNSNECRSFVTTAKEVTNYAISYNRRLWDNSLLSVLSNLPDNTITNYQGSTLQSDGTTVFFTFFAPNSFNVSIRGDFNSWNATANPMALTPDGQYWWARATITSAENKVYKYFLNNSDWVSDPFAKHIKSTDENAVIVSTNFSWQDGSFSTPPIQDLVIYELHTGDFTVSNNSGVTANYRGKYLGMIEKLDYLTNLGINAIQLMPISTFQTWNEYYSWGYMTSLFMAPCPKYEVSNAYNELKQLVNEAHKRGLAVIIDMVFNHTANGPNYLWSIDESYYFNPWGLKAGGVGYNNVNSTRKNSYHLIEYSMVHFMKDLHVDGFRLDLTGRNDNSTEMAINHASLEKMATNLKAINPNVILIAENWVSSTAQDKDLPSWAKWEGGFKSDMPAALNNATDNVAKYVWGNRDSGRFDYPWQSVMYLVSHDEHSPYHYLTTDKENRAKLGAAIMMTAMAVPMLWMGEEFGTYYWNETISKPLDWSLVSTNTNLFEYYKGLISLRLNHETFRLSVYPTTSTFRWVITPGDWGSLGYTYVNGGAGIVGFCNNYDGSISDNRFVVIFNYSTGIKNVNSVPFPVNGDWKLIGSENGINTNGHSTLTVSGGAANLSIPSKTAYIYMY